MSPTVEAPGTTPAAEPPSAARAGANAAHAAARAVGSQAGEFLAFRLGAEEYGVDILRVHEVRAYEVPAGIADMPACIKGVVNLRGVIVPIVDLRLKLGCASADYDTFTVVVVLHVRDRLVGAVVDSVSDVLELRQDQIHRAPEFACGAGASFINGIGAVKNGQGEHARERMLMLMDIEALMGAAELGLVD